MTKDEQIEALQAAIQWLVESQAVGIRSGIHFDGPYAFTEAGCGCCSNGELIPPDTIKAALDKALEDL